MLVTSHPQGHCNLPGLSREPEFRGDFIHNTGRKKDLTTLDMFFFGLSLAIPTVIGFYTAWRGRLQIEYNEYMLARRSMGFVPVGLSLLASFLSAATMLGGPSEVYFHNTMYFWIGVSFVLTCAVSAHVFIPVFYKLKLKSVYQVKRGMGEGDMNKRIMNLSYGDLRGSK